MVFSSAIFLFFFLPPVFLLSRLPLGKRWQNLLLAAASLVFYAFGNLQYVPLFLASVLLNYVTGLLLAWGVTNLKRGRALIDAVLSLPLVLPPTVGFTPILVTEAYFLPSISVTEAYTPYAGIRKFRGKYWLMVGVPI